MTSSQFERATARFADDHRADPRSLDGERTWSAYYHGRLLHWVMVLEPNASESLRLAAMCQHIRRWEKPRDDYPAGRSGYQEWRTALARFHADRAEEVLSAVGYGPEVVKRVRALLTKKGLAKDPEVQRFEDAICIVFLENEFTSFSKKHDDGKMITILRKTWKKMSAEGRRVALTLADSLPWEARDQLERAISDSGARPR